MTLDNVQVICKQCNVTKQSRSMSEMLEYCRMFVNKFGEKND